QRSLTTQALGYAGDNATRNRQQHQREDGQLGRHAEQQHEKADDGQWLLKHGREGIHHRNFHLVHIVGEARHEVALALV
nr:hypothetical protein [Tanacetum cinerariifolium]